MCKLFTAATTNVFKMEENKGHLTLTSHSSSKIEVKFSIKNLNKAKT